MNQHKSLSCWDGLCEVCVVDLCFRDKINSIDIGRDTDTIHCGSCRIVFADISGFYAKVRCSHIRN
jgi:hypothetical protein